MNQVSEKIHIADALKPGLSVGRQLRRLVTGKKYLLVHSGSLTENQKNIVLKNIDLKSIPKGRVACFKVSEALGGKTVAYLESLRLPEIRIFQNAMFNPCRNMEKLKVADVDYIRMMPQDLWQFARDSDKVFQIGVLVSDYCNLKCIMCPFFSEDPKYAFKESRCASMPRYNLELNVFKKLLDDITAKGKCSIRFSANGEPFMNPHFLEMLELSRDRGHEVIINTNGLLLTSSVIKRLASMKIQYLTFSIEGITKETYEQIRVGGNFEKVIAAIKECRALKDAGQASWEIQVFYNDLDELSFSHDQICDFFKDKADNITIRKPFMDIECRDFKGLVSLPFDGHRYCFDVLTYPYVLSSGDVVPCSVLANNAFNRSFSWAMNVNDHNFFDILSRYKQLASDHDSEFSELCVTCKFWQHSYRSKQTCSDPIFSTVDLKKWRSS